MSEPRKINTVTVAPGGERGKSMADVDAQMQRIQRAIYDQYTVRRRYTTPDGRRGLQEWTSDRGNMLYLRAIRAYNAYSQNIGRYLKPNAPEYEILWQTEENRRRKVPRSVYTQNNRR